MICAERGGLDEAVGSGFAVRGGGGEQAGQGALRAAHERGEAEEEVAAGVAGQAQLGKDEELRALAARLLHEPQDLFDVACRVRHPHPRGGRGDAQEAEGRGGHERRIPGASGKRKTGAESVTDGNGKGNVRVHVAVTVAARRDRLPRT